MKTALAIICSLLLAWTNIVLAQPPAANSPCSAPCCHGGAKSACCAAKQSVPEQLPVSAAPTFSSQSPFSPMLPEAVAWALPNNGPVHELSDSFSSSLKSASHELFARDCAWLI